MGEIADAMVNGELDAITGEYLDGKSPGYPRIRKGNKIVPFYDNSSIKKKKKKKKQHKQQ